MQQVGIALLHPLREVMEHKQNPLYEGLDFFLVFINYMFKGRIETNNRRRAEKLVTLLDEPYLAFFFNYLLSPPSAPAVGAMSVVVTVAYIAAVVELSLACLCSQLCYIVESQYQDVYKLNQ
jgi:hypothetical protein